MINKVNNNITIASVPYIAQILIVNLNNFAFFTLYVLISALVKLGFTNRKERLTHKFREEITTLMKSKQVIADYSNQ